VESEDFCLRYPLSTIRYPLVRLLIFNFKNTEKRLMYARFIHDGKAIDFLSATNVAAGTVIVEGDLVGVAKLDIEAGRLGALHVVGVFDVEKGNVAIPLGTKVYWDATAKQPVLTATGNKQLGICVQEATAEDAVVRVRLG